MNKNRLTSVGPSAIAGLLATVCLLWTFGALAKDNPSPSGSYRVITNSVFDSADDTRLKAGSVTVRSYDSGALTFESAETLNGWDYDVKSSGGTSDGNRVVVEFYHDLLNGKVTFMIEPGRLVIK